MFRGDITDDGAEVYQVDGLGRVAGAAMYLRDGDVESRVTAWNPSATVHYRRTSDDVRSFIVTVPS